MIGSLPPFIYGVGELRYRSEGMSSDRRDLRAASGLVHPSKLPAQHHCAKGFSRRPDMNRAMSFGYPKQLKLLTAGCLLLGVVLLSCRSQESGGEESNAATRDAAPLTPQEIARRSLSATLVLTMRDRNAQPFAIGSGFFVAEGIVATNAHVIAGARSGTAKALTEDKAYGVLGVVALDQARDLALLAVEGAGSLLAVSQEPPPEIGESIFVLGNPEGLAGTFSMGVISAHRVFGSDTLLQITAPISRGSSGGPVLNTRGEVVGVAVAAFRQGQNLNFAVPARWVDSLLNITRDTTPLSRVSEARPGRGSPWSGAGNAAVVGESFQWEGQFDFQSGYTFSLRNKSADDVRDVQCLVIFYDRNGRPVEADWVRYPGAIAAGLAQRVSSKVDPSVKRLTTSADGYGRYSYSPHTRIEYRILSYEIRQ